MSRYPFEPSAPWDAQCLVAGSDCAYSSVEDLLADLNGEPEETQPAKQSENQPV